MYMFTCRLTCATSIILFFTSERSHTYTILFSASKLATAFAPVATMDDLVVLARVPTISGGSLGHNANKAWCPEHRVELGVEFALISKRCTHFARFCTGKPIVMGSPTGATTVVEELVKIRDKAWGHMRSGITVDGDEACLKPLFHDDQLKKKAKLLPIEGLTIVTATVPAVSFGAFVAPSMEMRLLCEKPRAGLGVELNELDLKYLRCAVMADLGDPDDNKGNKDKIDAVRSSLPGVRWEYRRACWYCRFEDNEKVMRYKEFKVSGEVGTDEFELAKNQAESDAIRCFQDNAV